MGLTLAYLNSRKDFSCLEGFLVHYVCYRRRIVIFLSLIGLTLCGHYMNYLVGNFVTRMRAHVIGRVEF